jgi:hypothetical protein
MKTIFTLRFLCIISFLLLFCPFYNMCNGHGMRQKAQAADEIVDTTSVNVSALEIKNPIPVKKVEREEKTMIIFIFEKIYNCINDKNSQNAFEFAKMCTAYFENDFVEIKNGIITGIRKNDYRGFFFGLKNFGFLFIIILPFINLILSFTKKTKFLFRFSKWILILLLITIVCIFLEGLFEEISQIKWGYYAFTFVAIGVLFYTRQLLKPRLP